MLHEKDMLKKFWAEAVYTAIYLQNRLLTHAINGKTPLEAWSGLKPSVGHLKVFGSLCYMHVPDAKRDKLSEKAKKAILLGYSVQAKGYKIFDLQTGKMVVSRHITVDLNTKWNWGSLTIEKGSTSRSQSASLEIDVAQEEDAYSDFNVETTTDPPVLRTSNLADVYERCTMAVVDPSSFIEASRFEEWNAAMRDEISVIEKNGTWELVDRPQHKQVIGVKWVYRTKFNANGSIHKHKARLVVKGYAQEAGIDYGDTFAPVARLDTIKLLIALAA